MGEKTYEEWLEIVGDDGRELENIPEDMVTEELCIAAVTCFELIDFTSLFNAIPKKFITQKLCRAAVDRYAPVIEYVPDELIDEDMCIRAVEQGKKDTGEYLSSIPERWWTKNVCLSALQNSHIDMDLFPKLPEDICKDPEFLEKALAFPLAYGIEPHIPESLWEDIDFCHIAIKINYHWLDYVYEDLKTFDLCLSASRTAERVGDGAESAFEYIPEKHLSQLKDALKK